MPVSVLSMREVSDDVPCFKSITEPSSEKHEETEEFKHL
jgi:hypothetical protein